MILCKLFFNTRKDERDKGAVIIGLGKVGELTPGSLTKTFTHALLEYTTKTVRSTCEADDSPLKVSKFAVSVLLIGTGAGGISVEDSIFSILRAIRQANNALKSSGFGEEMCINEVELVELWQDRVIEAAHALKRACTDPDLKGWFDCEKNVRRIAGARTRLRYQEKKEWWQRLRITGNKDGSLKFSAITGKARAEVSTIPTQRALVNKFIEQAIGNTTSNCEVGRTLFELLLPNRLKEQARDQQDLVIVVDEESARYPWELLEDRWSDGKTPLATNQGVLRQLETDMFREKVESNTGSAALVIGNPQTSHFVDLPRSTEGGRICIPHTEGKRI